MIDGSQGATVRLLEVRFYERDTALRMPFRFGVVTLTEAPQVFVRARVRTGDGHEGWGWAAELMVPKWFDKSPDLTNEQNFDQLRHALAIAASTYAEASTGPRAPFALHADAAAEVARRGEEAGLPSLAVGFGPALLDRAILDALLRIGGVSVFTAVRANLVGLDARLTPDLAGFDVGRVLEGLRPGQRIAVRHTVGLADPLTEADRAPGERIDDGLPETLEEVVATYGVKHFKLKVSGDLDADVDRLARIAGVLDRLPRYAATLDGNEQFADVEGIVALWEAITANPSLGRLAEAILFVEQPIARAHALEKSVEPLARRVPVEIDESDATLDAFVRARSLGYCGISSKACKGLYRSLLNRARCAMWNEASGARTAFMSAEDLTTQAGFAVQQDLALATLIGCTHVERNGHHYVNGMAAAPEAEQDAFLNAHGDLYTRSFGAVRLAIEQGEVAIGSLQTPGLASAALPDPADLAHRTYCA